MTVTFDVTVDVAVTFVITVKFSVTFVCYVRIPGGESGLRDELNSVVLTS